MLKPEIAKFRARAGSTIEVSAHGLTSQMSHHATHITSYLKYRFVLNIVHGGQLVVMIIMRLHRGIQSVAQYI